MSRVVLIVFLLFLFFIICHLALPPKKKKLWFVIGVSIALIIDSGFRHLCVGPDTYQYFLIFEKVKCFSFSELFNSTFMIGDYAYIKDAGYWLFQKIFQLFSGSFRVFLICIAILFFFSLGRLLYRFLEDMESILMSYLFYIGMFWYFFSTTGCRQTIAVAFLMLAFPFLVKGHYLRYTFVAITCTFLHASAIVSLLALSVVFIRNRYFYVYLIIPLILVIYFTRYSIFGFLIESVEMEDRFGLYLETSDSSSSIMVTLFYLLVLLLCLVYRRKLSQNESLDYVINLYFIGMCFLPTMFIAATAMRITHYYSFTMYIIVPYIIKQFKFSNKYLVSILAMLILASFSIRKTWEYHFFWEESVVTSQGHSFFVKEEIPFLFLLTEK